MTKTYKTIPQKKTTIDILIWLLTTLLFSSFLILDQRRGGSYILLGTCCLIFVLFFIKNHGFKGISIDSFHIHVALFAFFCVVSALWSRYANNAITKGSTIFEILICISMLYAYYQKQDSIRSLLFAIKWASFICAIYTFIFYGLDTIRYIINQGERLGNDYANINSIALVASIGFVIVIYQWLYEGFSFSFLFAIPNVVIIAASGSRKALVFVLLGIFLLLLFKYSSKYFFSNVIKFAVILVGILILFNLLSRIDLFSGVMSRMEGLIALITGEGTVDGSAEKRNLYMTIAFRNFFKAPIFGVGMDNAKYVIGDVIGIPVYSHNNFSEILCNGGLVGFIIYYSMYFSCLKTFLKHRKAKDPLTTICTVITIGLLFTDWGMVSYYSKAQYFYFMIFFLQAKLLNNGYTKKGESL